LAQKIWARNFNERGKSSFRRKLPIEEKESYKWLEIMDLRLISLPKNITAVTVADREADIYELFHKAVQDNRELLIRATHDRRVAQEQERFALWLGYRLFYHSIQTLSIFNSSPFS
jgi:hypothetical protein